MKAKPLLFFDVIAALLWSWAVEAAPIRVRLMEGNFRGFVVLKSLDGAAIASLLGKSPPSDLRY